MKENNKISIENKLAIIQNEIDIAMEKLQYERVWLLLDKLIDLKVELIKEEIK